MDRSESTSSGRVKTEDILAHWGKLGMHWGQRKSSSSTTSTTDSGHDVQLHIKPGKGIIKTTGGHNRPVTEDAKKAAAYQQIATKSGVHALTNPEIQHLLNRVNLEQKYSKMQADLHPQSKGHKFVIGLMKSEGTSFLSGKKGPVATLVAKVFVANASKHSTGGSIVKTVDSAIANKGKKAAIKYIGRHMK